MPSERVDLPQKKKNLIIFIIPAAFVCESGSFEGFFHLYVIENGAGF
jgi:hypothetical protein